AFVIFGIILFLKFGDDALHSGSGSFGLLFAVAFALPIIGGVGIALAGVLRAHRFKTERADMLKDRRKIVEQNNLEAPSPVASPVTGTSAGTGKGTGAGSDTAPLPSLPSVNAQNVE